MNHSGPSLRQRLWFRSVPLLAGAVLALGVAAVPAQADDWPQWLGPQRDGVWREQSIMKEFPPEGPKVRWRAPIGQGYAGPAVAGDRVYVTDRMLSPDTKNPDNPFGRKAVPGTERILCLDDANGGVIWKHEYECLYEISYPAGPRATPVVADGKVYTLGAMGDLFCLDAATGKVSWSKNFPKDYKALVPMWGFSAHPLLDGDRLICLVGGPDSLVVAFHKDTGKEVWRSLTAKEPGYCPPMIYEFGGKRQLIIWHPEAVAGLDPQTGKALWSVPFAIRAALTIPTPRQAGDLLFVTSFYNSSLMLKFEAGKTEPAVLWKGGVNSEQPRLTKTLHSIMATPFIKDGFIYGVCSYGELRCLKADTGDRLWESMKATTGGPQERWSNAFIVAHEDRFFLLNEKGDLIIAKLTPQGYDEISRAHVIEPTNRMVAGQRKNGASVLWSHPAFAHQSAYVRNDKEIVCVSLADKQPAK